MAGMTATENAGLGSLGAGTYHFKLTYEYGNEGVLGESNASSSDVSITVSANASITLDNIPVPSRTDVTYKGVYRTLVTDETIYYWVERIPAAQTSVTITDGDSLLTSLNFQLEEDHDIPSRLKNLATHRGRIFGEDPDVAGRIRMSSVVGSDVFPDDPFYYSDELGQDGEEIAGLFRLGEGLFSAKKSKIWVLSGDTNANFIWDEVRDATGFTSGQSIARGDGVVYGLGPRDITVFDGIRSHRLSKVRGLVDLVHDVNKDSAVGVYRDRKFYLAAQAGSSTRRALVFVVHADPLPEGEGNEVSTISRSYTTNSTSTEFEVGAFGVWENEGERIFVGGYDGYVYEFDIGILWNRVGEDNVGADLNWNSNWIWAQGPAQFERYQKAFIMIESEGGEVDFDYEILTDDPNTTSSGSQTIDLSPTVTAATERIGRWNFSRWADG
jgi:hypothetical protein